MTIHYQDESVTVHAGDCLDVLRGMPDASVDAVVTDPPYGLEFMGKGWDGADGFRRSLNKADSGRDNAFGRASRTSPEYRAGALFQEWSTQWATECLRVLKPGGHLLAFGGTRTWHRLACAIEDAGFEMRDSIAWLYGSGFAKSWNFKTQFAGEWCGCNTLPYDHASTPDLRGVRGDLHSTAVARDEGEGAHLFASVQRGEQGSGLGEARAQGPGGLVTSSRSVGSSEDDGSTQSGVGGRELHRRQGLPEDSETGSSERTAERLRPRARPGDGVGDRPAGGVAGGGASHQRREGGQPTGESAAVPEPHGALDDGALRDGPVCPRCGGLSQVYQGFGSALKPAFEPVVVARKPLSGTLASTVLAHGTGALNIDGCRVEGEPVQCQPNAGNVDTYGEWPDSYERGSGRQYRTGGRWPANVVLDESQAAELDRQSGVSVSNARQPTGRDTRGIPNGNTPVTRFADTVERGHSDVGGASRFFPVFGSPTRPPSVDRRELTRLVQSVIGGSLDARKGSLAEQVTAAVLASLGSPDSGGGGEDPATRTAQGHQPDKPAPAGSPWVNGATHCDLFCDPAREPSPDLECPVHNSTPPSSFRYEPKAPTAERPADGTVRHPTVKPLDLMRWLVRLVTPPGGVVLDPFAGSGTTAEAAVLEHMRCVTIEREPDYLPLIVARLSKPMQVGFDFDGGAA